MFKESDLKMIKDKQFASFMSRAKDPEAKIGVMNEEFKVGLWE